MYRLPQIDRWLQDLSSYRRIALDTNTIIYGLEGVAPFRELAQHLFRLMERGLVIGTASTVVEAEMLVKPLRDRDLPTLQKVELFFRNSPNLMIRSVDRDVARRAAKVRATTRIRLPDAIIVATALEERCDAIVGNDFQVASQSIEIPYLCLDNYIE